MSDLVGNHIVGFPTRRLICCILITVLVFTMIRYVLLLLFIEAVHTDRSKYCVHGKPFYYLFKQTDILYCI